MFSKLKRLAACCEALQCREFLLLTIYIRWSRSKAAGIALVMHFKNKDLAFCISQRS
jgi:hypothetical protein